MKRRKKNKIKRKRAKYSKTTKVGKPYIRKCPSCFGSKCDYCFNYGTVTYVNIECNKCKSSGKVNPGSNFNKEDYKFYSTFTNEKYLKGTICSLCDGKGYTVGHLKKTKKKID